MLEPLKTPERVNTSLVALLTLIASVLFNAKLPLIALVALALLSNKVLPLFKVNGFVIDNDVPVNCKVAPLVTVTGAVLTPSAEELVIFNIPALTVMPLLA